MSKRNVDGTDIRMILYNLRCTNDHEFEAWFKDSCTYEEQVAASEIACPVCGIKGIEKAPMAPRIGSGAQKEQTNQTIEHSKFANVREVLKKVRAEIENNCDYVGPDFAEEARKIHYDEADPRNIYGETSQDEARALKEEGVDFTRVPWLPRNDS